jgi:hypothetical protein
MKPFQIQCDSCLAKLKVTKESAIGQILACPKCGSMVQVVSPNEPEHNVDATEPENSAEQESSSSPKAEARDNAPTPVTATQDLLPSDAWTSAETQARRKLLALGTLVTVGILVVLGAVGYLVTQLGKSEPTVAQNGESPTTPNDPTASEDSDSKVDNPQVDDPEVDDPTLTPSDPPTVDPIDQATDPSSVDATDPSSSTIDTEITKPVPPDPELEEPSDPVTPPGFETSLDEPGATISPFDTVLADLNALGSIMEESPFDKARALAEQELRVAYRVRITPSEIFADRPKFRDIDVDQQLALPIAELKIESTTLAAFIDLVRNLSGLAIMVDPLALQAANTSMDATLTVESHDLGVGELLQQNLEPLGLGWFRRENIIIVSLQGAGTLVTEEVPLGALAETMPAEKSMLPQLIMAMIEPSAWTPDLGTALEQTGSNLVVRQSPEVLYEIKQFLAEWQEQIVDHANTPPAILSRRDRAREMLETEVSLEHLQPKLLRQLVQELSEQVDGAIIVDWERLTEQGWTVDTELTCSLAALPLDLALDDLLRPAGLSFRVIHERLIQVTTVDAALGAPDIEFYDVSQLMRLGVSADEIARQLPLVFRAVGSQDPGKRFYFDADHQLLVAALPQPQQRAMARFLNAWTQFSARTAP